MRAPLTPVLLIENTFSQSCSITKVDSSVSGSKGPRETLQKVKKMHQQGVRREISLDSWC